MVTSTNCDSCGTLMAGIGDEYLCPIFNFNGKRYMATFDITAGHNHLNRDLCKKCQIKAIKVAIKTIDAEEKE